jgi:hypothetical protein
MLESKLLRRTINKYRESRKAKPAVWNSDAEDPLKAMMQMCLPCLKEAVKSSSVQPPAEEQPTQATVKIPENNAGELISMAPARPIEYSKQQGLVFGHR